MHRGSCLCNAISFTIEGDLAPASICHCSQCRKQSGHAWASTHIPKAALNLSGQDNLRWIAVSDIAKRGFCGACGSTLFWDPVDEDKISVSMGAIDPPHRVRIERHIFTAFKGDYYDINDGLPQKAT